MVPPYDPSDADHVRIRDSIERGNAISNLQTVEHCRNALGEAGYRIEYDEDYAQHWRDLGRDGGTTVRSDTTSPSRMSISSAPITPVFRPWYYPLAGQTSPCTTWEDWSLTVRMTQWVRSVSILVIWTLELLHIAPRRVLPAMRTMEHCVDSVVEGGQKGIFTPCWFFIGRKGDEGGDEVRPASDVRDEPGES